MSGDVFAVLIGINEYEDTQNLAPLRYAQKDCEDLYNVLVDPKIGRCSPGNVKMLLGADATTRKVEVALHTLVVKDRTPDDMIIVYFSGHGFIAGDRGLAYLGTQDVQIKDLIENPNFGLRMDRVYEDYFMASHAKNVIFIIDCCHSGALTPTTSRGIIDPETRGLIDRKLFSSGTGRVALVACPPDAVSRESTDLQNGIFTHYILRGLSGEAVETPTGDVTLDSLLSFVRIHAPEEQPPGSYGQYYGRIVLSSPGQVDTNKLKGQVVEQHAFEAVTPSLLGNPLEPFVSTIRSILSSLSVEISPSLLPEKHILNTLKKSLDAEYAFVLRSSGQEWFLKAHSEINDEIEELISSIVPRAAFIIESRKKSDIKFEDSHYPYEDNSRNRRTILIIPTKGDKAGDYIVVYGIKNGQPALGDVFTRIIKSIFTATRELTLIEPRVVEAVILDCLKENYRHIPLELYNRRYDLFCDRLQSVAIHFEPVLYLEPGNLYIASWEALARDPASLTAPNDLFDAAKLWGTKFTTELDIIFAQKALLGYRQALIAAKLQRPYETQDLSVNVYPETLMRTAYLTALKNVLKESKLATHKLYLEISEKTPIPEEAKSIEEFKEKLTNDYIRGLKIGGFAIDDFGVGHASVSRLARLEPEYVKIDRDVLEHEYTEAIIRFVLQIATQGSLRHPKVMVEGYEGSGSINLRKIHDLGVRFIQGYLIGKAGPHLYRLEKEPAQYLENLLNRQD